MSSNLDSFVELVEIHPRFMLTKRGFAPWAVPGAASYTPALDARVVP